MNDKKTEQTLIETNVPVLTNAVALVSNVVARVSGNAIANTVGGKPVSQAFLEETVAARLQSIITPQTGG